MTDSPGYDAIVIGAGAAGLLASLRAASLGAEVLLLDDAAGDSSNLAASSGLFSAAGTRTQAAAGITDSAALWAADIARKTEGAFDPAMVRIVTTRAADAAHFLADTIGLTLHVATIPVPGHSAARLHATAGESGREMAALLMAAAQAMPGLTVLKGVEATGLLTEHGAVMGVQTGSTGYRARWTLLACGGFAGNDAMIARYMPEMVGAHNIGLGRNDGRALAWGEALGGALLFMEGYQGQGHVTVDGLGRLGPGLTSLGAIVVNARGERFADESMGPSEFGAFVLAQPGGWAVEVFDEAMHQSAMSMGPYRETVARGCVVKAVDAAALAAAFGLPETALSATLAAYHDAGPQDPFGRAPRRPVLPPYRAAKITGGMAHTQGGLRVDDGARVLRADGTVVAGLLAAGGAAAGVSGRGAAGYIPGNGLGQAFALGLAAGETIAAQG
ncbi:FAD-dependent oxidoreductase [Acidisphaera sp. L21]|uniref:FAD-dependent oxidoreductase n=1 Tax=Acidisphaera sp. L21 TaxID=1641851 RepID=UPI00131E7192|nr:FAD-dependent oxidoreductase [Acidisphaera sp. L21]